MFSSTFKQCWWLDLESIHSFKDTINDGVHVEPISKVFLELSLLFDLRGNALFLLLLPQLVELNYTKVKFVKVVDVRVLFFEPLHKVSCEVGFVEFIFLPNGSNRLGPVISELFLIWSQSKL